MYWKSAVDKLKWNAKIPTSYTEEDKKKEKHQRDHIFDQVKITWSNPKRLLILGLVSKVIL